MSDLTKQEFLAKYGEKAVTWDQVEQRYSVTKGSFYASVFEGRWGSGDDAHDIMVSCQSSTWPNIHTNQPTVVGELDICDGTVYIYGCCPVDNYQAD